MNFNIIIIDLLKKDFYDAKKAPFTLEQKMAAPFGTVSYYKISVIFYS